MDALPPEVIRLVIELLGDAGSAFRLGGCSRSLRNAVSSMLSTVALPDDPMQTWADICTERSHAETPANRAAVAALPRGSTLCLVCHHRGCRMLIPVDLEMGHVIHRCACRTCTGDGAPIGWVMSVNGASVAYSGPLDSAMVQKPEARMLCPSQLWPKPPPSPVNGRLFA
jgi:hypothetical protein